MNLFRGYVRLSGKQSIDKFKNAEPLELEEVQNNKSYGGVLAQDVVLIDIDDAEQADRFFAMVKNMGLCCQVRQTTRGKHFFFKNDGTWDKAFTGKRIACGLTADCKLGVSNGYACLKKDGIVREIIYDEPDLMGEYDTPPIWLRRCDSNIDLFNLSDGDGRNDALFKYILPLQSAGFSREEIIEILSVVNDWIFDKPLSKSEFETITREESFEKALIPNFFEGKVFKFADFAKWLVKELHIKRINGLLHTYKDGVYVDGEKAIAKSMINIIDDLTDARRNEVLKYIDVYVDEDWSISSSNYIAFKNGVLDLDTNCLLPFTPDIVVVNQLPWDYNPNAKSELLERTLDKLACGDMSIRALLEEMAGYCMYRRNELRKAFILTGDKGNGKSTWIAMLMTMLGEDNTCSLDLKELGDRFKTAEIYRKLANLGDDIGCDFIGDLAIFKKLVSGDRVTAERKNKDPFTFVNYAKMVFSANELPRAKDKTGAVVDRLIIIPFNARFTKNDPDYRPFIKYELQQKESIEYLIKLAVEGLKRVLERRSFTNSEAVNKQVHEYDLQNNPIKIFFSEIDKDEIEREPVSEWYKRYQEFCLVNQIQNLSKIEFGKAMKREFKLDAVNKKIDGKAVRFYKKLN